MKAKTSNLFKTQNTGSLTRDRDKSVSMTECKKLHIFYTVDTVRIKFF